LVAETEFDESGCLFQTKHIKLLGGQST